MNILRGSIWAGIVAYNPNFYKLGGLINSLLLQVDHIVVYNNGGCSIDDLRARNVARSVTVLGEGRNVGIATALNEIFVSATENSVEYLVTFDQDSTPSMKQVPELLQFIKGIDDSIDQVAAIGPLFVDDRGENEIFPIFQAGRFWVRKISEIKDHSIPIQTSIIITSGMLVRLSTWKSVGVFRDDFFIDHVDTEWCLRAISMGYKLLICPWILMSHEISDAPPKRFLGRLVLKYSPLRRYYYFRNTVVLARLKYTPFGLKMYFILTLCYRFFLNSVVDESRAKSIRAMRRGIVHGLTGRMGKLDVEETAL